MSAYPFLSEDWIAAARAIHRQHAASGTPPAVEIRMNLVVEGVPDTGRLEVHVDSTSGVVEIDLGHLEGADVRVSTDYETARAILVDNDANAGMAAFMAGRVLIEGDVSKLLAYQPAQGGSSSDLVASLRAITA
jgi:hypothetical protein